MSSRWKSGQGAGTWCLSVRGWGFSPNPWVAIQYSNVVQPGTELAGVRDNYSIVHGYPQPQ